MNMETSLLDEVDPTVGIKIKYLNGSAVHCGFHRTMTINIYCRNHAFTAPVIATIVEHTACSYTATLASPFACPTSCTITNFDLCSDNGICAFDARLGEAKCMCNNGFSGKTCTETKSKTISTLTLGLSIMTGVLFIVEVLV